MRYAAAPPRFFSRHAVNAMLAVLIALLAVAGVRLRGRGGRGEPAAETPPAVTPGGARVRLYDHDSGSVVFMELEDYVCHAVAAEMPASYAAEALKAQAVAVRTLAVRALLGDARTCREGTDLCTDAAHCQAFDSDRECAQQWGSGYEEWWAKITQAVRSTQGVIMTYGGEPIEVLYHAVSGGRTEDVENVFPGELPYLRGVESPGEEGYAHFRGQASFGAEEFAGIVEEAFPGAGLTANGLAGQVGILGRFESGRVSAVRLGGLTATGRELRGALGLPSARFTITFSGDRIIFDCVGFGHGVGMSQAGADAMAQSGSGYAEILAHYYAGVTLERWPESSLTADGRVS